MTENCAICGEAVEIYAQSDHLRFKHPAPEGGFKFWHNGKPFTTDKPSMLVSEVIKMVDAQPTYAFEDEHGNGFSHANAVDLTHEPRFYSIPPATYYAR